MPERGSSPIDREAIVGAHASIQPHIRRTPIIDVDARDWGLSGFRVTLKLEQLQHAGSFKARGAFANLMLRQIPQPGVVAASGGNHGVAVAYAACRPAFTLASTFPASHHRPRSPRSGITARNCRSLATATPTRWKPASHGWHSPVHCRCTPMMDRRRCLGRAHLGLELQAQAPDLDTLLVAVGGGGLLGGIAAWYDRRIRLIGVEPETAPTLTRALEAGRPVDAPAGGIAADSLAPDASAT